MAQKWLSYILFISNQTKNPRTCVEYFFLLLLASDKESDGGGSEQDTDANELRSKKMDTKCRAWTT
jgi:hypothetical protein